MEGNLIKSHLKEYEKMGKEKGKITQKMQPKMATKGEEGIRRELKVLT